MVVDTNEWEDARVCPGVDPEQEVPDIEVVGTAVLTSVGTNVDISTSGISEL